MDYSLLLAIEYKPRGKSYHFESNRRRNTQAGRFSLNLDEIIEKEEELIQQRRTSVISSLEDSVEQDNFLKEKHCFYQENKIYHIAVIDYLQEWNTSKKSERCIKTNLLGKNGDDLSAIEPNQYAKRFLKFYERYLFN